MSKKQSRCEWAKKEFGFSNILYYCRKRDWLSALKAKAPGAFMARWYSGFGWGFIGGDIKL